ncbi:unnamed protein product [Schistosoma intercalatum]|nr:unnamed protein product [Schistosoma intercalatum]CAH8578256.1 unnamed protein product [Schistosoma intercalatum]
MDYLTNIILYLSFSGGFLLCYCLRHTMMGQVLKFLLLKPVSVIWITMPFAIRKMISETIIWFLFERHCVYQFVYLSCIIFGHYILIMDVITVLYRYSWLENNLFLGSGCLFLNGLLYMLLCFSDPGFITSRNKSVYAHIYEYDNFIYSPKQCTICCHIIPARSKHCSRCDRCIFRFDHHCVWTNCCIGGQNHGLFITFLFSLCFMIANALWLNCRMLYLFSVHENLWQAHYLDEYDQMHPMDWLTLLQHLFMTFPRVIGLTGILIVVVMLLINYLTFHIWLILINCTSYEYFQGKKLITSENCSINYDDDDNDDKEKNRKIINKKRHFLSTSLFDSKMVMMMTERTMMPSTVNRQLKSNHRLSGQNPTSTCHNYRNFYNKGIRNNLLEMYTQSTSYSLRELKHRLPVQLAFKTR